MSKLASLALYAVMARELGREGLGNFVFATALVLLVEVADLGIDTMITREIARTPQRLAGLFWNGLGGKLVLGLAGAAVALAVVSIAGYEREVVFTVALLAVARLVELTMKTGHALLRGIEDMAPIALSFVIQRFVFAGFGTAALLSGAKLIVVAATAVLGSLAGLGYITRAMASRGIKPGFELSPREARALVVRSLPVGVSGMFTSALARLDAALLSLLKNNAAVGLYGAAYRIFESPFFITWAFALAVFPPLSRLDRDTRPSIGAAFELACKAVLAMLLPISTVLVLFSGIIVETLYGASFRPAESALRLLGPGVVLYGLFFVSAYLLVSQNRERLISWVTGAILIENVVLNLVLIPTHSFDGAALAMTVSQATGTVAMMALALRVTGRMSPLRVAFGPAAASAGMALMALAVGTSLVGLIAAAAAYFPILFAAERWLFPADAQVLIDLVVRRRRRPEQASAARQRLIGAESVAGHDV